MNKLLLLPIAALAAAPQAEADSPFEVLFTDSINWSPWEKPAEEPQGPLSEADYEAVAYDLGVDAAAIHAVIDIEAGAAHKGFWAEGKPVINFDSSRFKSMAAKRGVNLKKHAKSPALAPLDTRRYGSQQAAQQARLDAAMAIDADAAIESTYWGMFQIGGFNWHRCGATSPTDFAERMSASERDQLELFANFLLTTGLDVPLRQHDWRAFARGYNGASYAAQGYHTKLANAYTRYTH